MNLFKQTIELLQNLNFYYIITTNMAGKYSYVNNRYAKSYSFISESIIGMPYEITMHPEIQKYA